MERVGSNGGTHNEQPIGTANGFLGLVVGTAKAAPDVDDFEHFVKVQSEAAVRHLASIFAYDSGDDPAAGTIASTPTLLESADVVARALIRELRTSSRSTTSAKPRWSRT